MPALATPTDENDLGEFSQFVPAPASTPAVGDSLGEFGQFVPPPDSTAAYASPEEDLGEFGQFVPKTPTHEAEKALAETPRVEEIKAAPSILEPTGVGRFPISINVKDAAYLVADKIHRFFEPTQPTSALQEHGAGDRSLLGTTEKIPYAEDDDQITRGAKAVVNVGNEFLAGMTSPEGIAMFSNPVTGLAALADIPGQQFVRVKQALDTPAGSPERWEAGLSTVALLGLPAVFKAVSRAGEPAKAKEGVPSEVPTAEPKPEPGTPTAEANALLNREPQSLETKLPVETETPPEPGTPAPPVDVVPPVEAAPAARTVTFGDGTSVSIEPGKSISGRDVIFIDRREGIRTQVNTTADVDSFIRTQERIHGAAEIAKPLDVAPPVPPPVTFTPSTEWQEVPQGTVLPNGGEFRMDQATGKNYARWEPDNIPTETASVPFGFGPGAASAGELPPWRASATAMQERINNLITRQQSARTPEKATRDTLREADKWLEADRDEIRTRLLSFSKHLPLHDRAKFLPAITSAMRRAPILSRDPGVMYRRAEAVLNRMTESVYDVNRKTVIGDIDKLLTKTAESKSMTVPEKETIRERGNTFNALKDKMSFDMLTAMHERMTEIAQKGKELFAVDQVMETERVNATLREIKAQGVRRIDKPEQTRLALGETETAWQRRINQLRNAPSFIKHFNLALTPMDWLIQTFDKVPNGVLYRRLKLPVDVRYGEWLDASHGYKGQLAKAARGLEAGNFDRIYAHAELRQEGGLENLKALGYSEKEINSAKTLTRPELEYLREADRINNELFPHLKEVLSKFFHQEIEKVEGYFPRQRDWDYYNTLSIEEGKFARAFNRSNTEKGFTVSRVGATTKNITNAHEVMMNHIDDVLYHIKLGPEIRRIADVVKSKDFANSVGSLGQRVFSDWVDVLSRNGGVSAGRRIRALDILRKNVGVAQLAFRLTTTGLQPLSLIQGMALASPKNISIALSGVMSKTRRQFMLDNFPEIRARVGDDPAYSDYGGGSMRDKFARGGFKAISVLDRFAALTIGEAAYRDSLAKRGIAFDLTKVDPAAVQDAQKVVRQTQSSAYAKDVPLAISRGNFTGNASVDKAIFQFQNFLVNKWALIKNGALQMGIEDKSVKAGARIATFVILGTIAEQMSRDGIKRLIRATFGTTKAQEKEQEKMSDQSYALQIGEKAAIDLVTSMPVVSNVFGMAKYEGSGIPVLDTLENVIEGATKLASGKKTETKVVGGIRAGQAVGALAGVPTGQAGDILVQTVRAKAKNKSDSSESIPAPPVGLPNL